MNISKIFILFCFILFMYIFYPLPLLSQSVFAYKIGVGPCKWVGPDSIVILSYQGADYFAGASWVNGRWCAVTYLTHNFIYCDTTTGTNTIIGNIGPVSGSPVATCWDPTTGKMFMVTTSPNNLYTINMNTGADSLIAPITGTAAEILTAAVGNNGTLFSIELVTAQSPPTFGRINKTTGQWTTVGPMFGLGHPDGPQGMAFYRPYGWLYWPYYQQNGGAAFFRIDTTTGIPTLIGPVPDNAEYDGMIWTDNYVGIKNESNELPKGFSLSQNYPNPFNPVTRIKFDIPISPLNERGDKGGFVKMTIYGLLGKEVAALVNESLKPGTYEVEWDGSNYPSGVYFYVLNAGDYSESKKMILMK